jgi:predicted acetyltransferase
MSHAAHLERLRRNARGEDLPAGRVPSSMLYGFVAGRIIGRVSIRHELNAFLQDRGGHVGYSVAPAERRRGYATELLRLTLPFCRELGLERLLLTCDDANEPSWRIIERAGGRLEDRRTHTDGSLYRRYWIDLTASAA